MSSGSTAAVNSIVPPPPGVVPNFVNPHRVTGGVVPVSAVFLTLSTIALAIRLYTKIGIIKIFGAEDGEFRSTHEMAEREGAPLTFL